jgi:hypothetical protein
VLRADARPAAEAAEAVVSDGARELRFRPGSAVRDRRGSGWELDGDLGVLDLRIDGASVDGDAYPDALGRLWAALVAPNAGDVLVSLSDGCECVDWGGASHAGGGSHGGLGAEDSLGPLLVCGLEGFAATERAQWTVADVAGLVDRHFAVARAETEDVGALAGAG